MQLSTTNLALGTAILAIAFGVWTMSQRPESPTVTQELAPVKKAQAILHPTKNSKVKGTVTFTGMDGGGVLIVADVDNLTPGKHGFHIHEFGDCSADDGSSAGGHFNPKGTKHGGPQDAERHAGDLGNLVADDKGHAHFEFLDLGVTLAGKDTIVGRSVVVHADEDDFKAQPAGNSGARLACGKIVKVE